jgi:hypothetical protein
MFTYQFEEQAALLGGRPLLCDGSVVVLYTKEAAQDDCGYPGGIEIYDYHDFEITFAADENGEEVELTAGDIAEIKGQILSGLDEGYIVDEIEG